MRSRQPVRRGWRLPAGAMRGVYMRFLLFLLVLVGRPVAMPGASVTMQDGTGMPGELTLAGNRIILRADGKERLVPLDEVQQLRFIDPDHPPVGLLGAYYANPNVTRLMGYKVETQPRAELEPGRAPRSVRWTGWLIVPVTGRYQFGVDTSDLAALWIDGKRVLNYKGAGEFQTGVNLQANQRYPIRIEFSSRDGRGYLTLNVEPPEQPRQPLPEQWLLAGPMPPADQGTYVEYFKGHELREPVGARILAHPSIFSNEQFPDAGRFNFSVRFTARLSVPRTDEYTFHVDVDDGARIGIDDTLVLDAWKKGAGAQTGKPIRLNAQRTYGLRVEYMQVGDPAHLAVDWSARQMPRAPLPAEALRVPTAHGGGGSTAGRTIPARLFPPAPGAGGGAERWIGLCRTGPRPGAGQPGAQIRRWAHRHDRSDPGGADRVAGVAA